AAAAAVMVTPPGLAGPARRAAIGGVAAELGLMRAMEKRLGFVGEVYEKGEAGRYGRISKVCAGLGAGLLALGGRRSRPVAVTASAFILAGELSLPRAGLKAGLPCARAPARPAEP